MDTNIMRPQTELEKKDFKLLGRTTPEQMFRKRVVEKEQQYVKNHKPFCFRCAKLDYEDLFEKKVKELQRKVGYDATKIAEIDVDIKNLDVYGDEKRFEVIDVKEVNEDKLIDGMRASVLTNYNIKYRCKEKGCRINVFVPKAIYEERTNKKIEK